MIRTVPFWRTTRVVEVILVVLALLLSPSPALAAKARTPPTTPTNLYVTATTANSVKLAWDASTDNLGSFSYRVHLVSPSMDKVVRLASAWIAIPAGSAVGQPRTFLRHCCASCSV